MKKKTPPKFDRTMYECLQQLSSKVDALMDVSSMRVPVNNSAHSNIMLIREITHFIATPLANIEGNVELLGKTLNQKKTD